MGGVVSKATVGEPPQKLGMTSVNHSIMSARYARQLVIMDPCVDQRKNRNQILILLSRSKLVMEISAN